MSTAVAYENGPIPIGSGQTISQPYIAAPMAQSLKLQGDERVLEINTGSGYQTALLAELADEVFTVERVEKLSQSAQRTLSQLIYANVSFKVGDDSLGWSEKALFGAILVTAAASTISVKLTEQLGEEGRIVTPVDSPQGQRLICLTAKEKTVNQEDMGGCIFVALIGSHGYQA